LENFLAESGAPDEDHDELVTEVIRSFQTDIAAFAKHGTANAANPDDIIDGAAASIVNPSDHNMDEDDEEE